MIYKARGRESEESRRIKEQIYELKQQYNYQLVLFEEGCDVFGIRNGIRVATEVERRASPQVERNIRRDFNLGIDVLIIACRSETLRCWIEEKVLPHITELRQRIRLITFAEIEQGDTDVFDVASWAPRESTIHNKKP